MESTESITLIFPANSLFDSFFIYGVDDSKTLKKVAESSLTPITLEAGALEDTPVSIFNNQELGSLIIVTKDSATDQHTVAVVNT